VLYVVLEWLSPGYLFQGNISTVLPLYERTASKRKREPHVFQGGKEDSKE